MKIHVNIANERIMSDISRTDLIASQNWLQNGIQGQSKTIRPLWQKYEDENITKILGLPTGRQNNDKPKRQWKQSCTLCGTTVQGHACNTGIGKSPNNNQYDEPLGYNWCKIENPFFASNPQTIKGFL